MGTQGAKQTGANSGNPIEPDQGPKGALAISVCHDGFGERETHAWEPSQLSGRSGVRIHALPGTQRPTLPHGAVTLRRGRPGRQQREKLNLPRGLAGFGNQIPDALTQDREGDEQEHRSAFGTEHMGGYGGTAGLG